MGTTWVFWSFIFATRPVEVGVGADTLSSLVRLPASLPAQLAADHRPVLEPVKMEVMALSCWDRQEAALNATSARWLRLTGRACQMSADADSIMVQNLSNGYVATVFAGRDQSLTTDFIPLQIGKNDIQIRMNSAPGVHIDSHFTLVRQ